jgi:predicted nucleic acid-binding protein
MRLTSRRAKLCVTMQNIAEYWNVATRPVAQNGFGLSIDEAEREIRAVERGMVLLPDSEFVYRLWRKLILSHRVSGKQVHDARLVASMRVHGVRHLLTLNTADFRRYSGIVPVHPSEIR